MNSVNLQPYLDRAKKELRAVEINIREGFYAIAISRTYYALFYAASGLLESIGESRSKHSGVISAFRQHFIKTNIIEREYGEILGVGFDSRQESDYELIPSIDYEMAAKRLQDAQRFIDRIEIYLKDRGMI